ncbi:MAG TPA: hypothetical protein VGR38_02000 [Candidatus Polarisedimenticolia bacterium]|jgi:hypothetical protein|nr:hypothetical protein [Candidatus Polarisedimenticolia bacterium]
MQRMGFGAKRGEVGASRFRPGEFAQSTREDDSSDWGYVQLTVAF